MATYNVLKAKHATLAANTIDTVNLSAQSPTVRISNRSTQDIFFTVNSQDQSDYSIIDAVEPGVAADDVFCVPANDNILRSVSPYCAQVKLIADHSAKYSVEAQSA